MQALSGGGEGTGKRKHRVVVHAQGFTSICFMLGIYAHCPVHSIVNQGLSPNGGIPLGVMFDAEVCWTARDFLHP